MEKGIKKNEALLWLGSWTSRFGNIVFDYANSISIVSFFAGKPIVLALYQSSETIIQIIFNLVGGVKADNGNRKRLVIITDILAGLICFVLSFFINSGRMAMVVIAANALLALVYAFNSPTYKSLVREMIYKDRIGFYNSIAHAGSEIIGITGPILSVGLVAVIGTRGALLFDAVTFFVSALLECCLVRVVETPSKVKGSQNVITDIIEGIKYLLSERQIFFLVILSALVNFFLAGYNLLLPYTDVMYKGIFDNFYSKALAMEALGGILGSLVISKAADRFKDNVYIMILFLSGTGIAMLAEPIIAPLQNMYLCLIPFALFGIALTSFNIILMSHVQVSVDENFLGRVFSIIFTVAVLFMPVGSFSFSAFVDAKSVGSFAIVGGGIVILSLFSLIMLKVIGSRKCSD